MAKKKFKYDEELKKTIRVADSEAEYKDILKDAVITRVANSGSMFIEQTTKYSVSDFEADPDFIIYEYEYDGVIYKSNFKYANPINIIYPTNYTDEPATTN